jgi:hypothetical protein
MEGKRGEGGRKDEVGMGTSCRLAKGEGAGGFHSYTAAFTARQ